MKHNFSASITCIIFTGCISYITAISEAYRAHLEEGFLSGAGGVVTQQGIRKLCFVHLQGAGPVRLIQGAIFVTSKKFLLYIKVH